MTCAYRRQKKEKQGHTGRRAREDGGGNWSDASTSQDTPRSASSHQERGMERVPRQCLQKELTLLTPSCQPLASRAEREYISVAVSHPVCGRLSGQPRRLTQSHSWSAAEPGFPRWTWLPGLFPCPWPHRMLSPTPHPPQSPRTETGEGAADFRMQSTAHRTGGQPSVDGGSVDKWPVWSR